MMKKFAAQLMVLLAFAVGFAAPAHAALDAAVTTAITAAQTDLLLLLTALTVAGAAIWVGRLIYSHFKVR